LKTILISSAVSLAIGFTFGWLIKSASSELDSIVTVTAPDAPRPRPPEPTPEPTPETPPERDRPERPSTENVPAKNLPRGTAEVPESVKRADRAKWMRLIEVLGLNDDQAKALEAAMAQALPKNDTGTSPEVTYTEAGERLEKSILALLDADQQVAFQQLKQRFMENRIESKAQETYFMELSGFDLSKEQRERALSLLRGREEELASEIPGSTHLLLAGSFLPIGDERFTEDAIRLLRQLSPQETGDITLDKLAARRRAEAEEKAALFESILTPAQLELYRSRVSETPDLLDRIRSGD
jgi:hypothetical protein